MSEWKPRLSVELTEKQYEGLSRLERGWKKALFHAIIDDINQMMDEHGDLAVAAIASYSFKFSDVIMKKLD